VSNGRLQMHCRFDDFGDDMLKPGVTCLLAGVLAPPALAAPARAPAPEARQRLLVLTDIEADPDDTQSLVRLLLYANDIDIEGIVATTSVHMKNAVHPDSVRAVIARYGRVQANLARHDPAYPPARRLLDKVSQGLPVYGMAGVGDGRSRATGRSAPPIRTWRMAWRATRPASSA
jgi:hypothetical protein